MYNPNRGKHYVQRNNPNRNKHHVQANKVVNCTTLTVVNIMYKETGL